MDRNAQRTAPKATTKRRPFTGAWIETYSGISSLGLGTVAPSRGRGSKRILQGEPFVVGASPLHGGVDRNSILASWEALGSGRPFTGAWIETSSRPASYAPRVVAPSRGRGSKQQPPRTLLVFQTSPLHGGVDRNLEKRFVSPGPRGSPLHGGVDRNEGMTVGPAKRRGRPFTGAWIETHPDRHSINDHAVAPSRGRGSKRLAARLQDVTAWSPLHGGVDRNLAWMRLTSLQAGSPLHGGVDRNLASLVTMDTRARRPFTGAWIETPKASASFWMAARRPFTGAWIETACLVFAINGLTSPLHGGVDRNDMVPAWCLSDRRRPFTGAWIETRRPLLGRLLGRVAPSRGRGSKPSIFVTRGAVSRSPLHGGVDRNKNAAGESYVKSSRPFTGAWIETASGNIWNNSNVVAPSRGRGSKRGLCRLLSPCRQVAPSRGRGSKQKTHAAMAAQLAESPLHGGVDRNKGADRGFAHGSSRPFTGAWIETRWPDLGRIRLSSPLHGGVDRNIIPGSISFAARGRPFTGAWIETAFQWSEGGEAAGRPFTGAWIETLRGMAGHALQVVAPSRGRGSKRMVRTKAGLAPAGRPFTGAWIETRLTGDQKDYDRVAPSRGRGSKHCSDPAG